MSSLTDKSKTELEWERFTEALADSWIDLSEDEYLMVICAREMCPFN